MYVGALFYTIVVAWQLPYLLICVLVGMSMLDIRDPSKRLGKEESESGFALLLGVSIAFGITTWLASWLIWAGFVLLAGAL